MKSPQSIRIRPDFLQIVPPICTDMNLTSWGGDAETRIDTLQTLQKQSPQGVVRAIIFPRVTST